MAAELSKDETRMGGENKDGNLRNLLYLRATMPKMRMHVNARPHTASAVLTESWIVEKLKS